MASQPQTRPRWFLRLCKTLLITAVVAYVMLFLASLFLTDPLLFVHSAPSYQDTKDIIKLTTSDGEKISAVYLPNLAAKYTFLYSHGNGGDLGAYLPLLHSFHDMGFAVFCYDYHGFGTSEGVPSEQAAYLDVTAAYDYLTRHLHIPPRHIIAFGRSLGGGPTAYLAAHYPVAGVIMESTFTSAFRVVTQIPLLPCDKFDSIDNIKRVHCPVLVIHGASDHTIPFSHGMALYRAAPQPKRRLWVPHADHVYLPETAGARYPRALHEFTQLIDAQGR